MNKLKTISTIIILILFLSYTASAHPGRTDANGGHWDHSTGEYHYHDGRYAGHTTHNSDNPSDYASYIHYPDIFGISLEEAEKKYQEGYDEGYNEGYKDATEESKKFSKKLTHNIYNIFLIIILLTIVIKLCHIFIPKLIAHIKNSTKKKSKYIKKIEKEISLINKTLERDNMTQSEQMDLIVERTRLKKKIELSNLKK